MPHGWTIPLFSFPLPDCNSQTSSSLHPQQASTTTRPTLAPLYPLTSQTTTRNKLVFSMQQLLRPSTPKRACKIPYENSAERLAESTGRHTEKRWPEVNSCIVRVLPNTRTQVWLGSNENGMTMSKCDKTTMTTSTKEWSKTQTV